MNAIDKVLSDISLERGKASERRFFEAMKLATSVELPDWLIQVESPTHVQDRFQGIDAIVVTDVGKLFLQIKSSKAGETRFLNGRHPRRNKLIRVIVIHKDDTLEEIRAKARGILSKLRYEILQMRSSINS